MRYLFERIVSPCQPNNLELIREDVRAQVQRLIDSHRISQHRGAVDVLNLDVPSVTEIGANSQTDQRAYASNIARIIKRFEPRLANVDIAVVPSSSESRAPQLIVQAQLRLDEFVEEFRFVSPLEGV